VPDGGLIVYTFCENTNGVQQSSEMKVWNEAQNREKKRKEGRTPSLV
jgi:hypothetical protein